MVCVGGVHERKLTMKPKAERAPKPKTAEKQKGGGLGGGGGGGGGGWEAGGGG